MHLTVPRFMFFDLGNVLLQFSHQKMAQQLALVSGASVERVWQILFQDGLEWEFERGAFSPQEFHLQFSEQTQTNPSFLLFEQACSDIFEPLLTYWPVLNRLKQARFPLGIFSNTNVSHWQYVLDRYRILRTGFSTYALSYELQELKPHPAAYARAARLAGVEGAEILFLDDRPENVAAAQKAHWQAILAESPAQVLHALRTSGMNV